MEFLLSINWISFSALTVVLLLFVLLNKLITRVNWTLVILLSLALGAAVGILFASEGNAYLVWVDLMGSIYVNAITALVAPVILISIISSFISLRDTSRMKTIGVRSIFWLLLSAAAAIVLSIVVGLLTNIGGSASSVFAEINSISADSVSAYAGLTQSFDQVFLALFPSNIISDLAENNVVAIIIIAIALAVAYITIASKEGEGSLSVFKDFVEAAKKIIYRILKYVIRLTPYAVLCLIAGSASTLLTNKDAILQMLLLVVLIYGVALVHTYVFNGLIVKYAAKISPIQYFKKISSAQATAFTTQSSVGTLPVSIETLTKNVGVKEEIANFTAPLGTTIGMPGCTCVWPVLLVIFYVHASGLNWNVSNYVLLAILTLLLSIGSAGVPGIAVVSAVGLFSALDLPIAAVILFMPINTISDMVRTLDNVTSASAATVVVARAQGQLDDTVFHQESAAKSENEEASV